MVKFNDDFNRIDSADIGANWDAGYYDPLQIVSNRIRNTAGSVPTLESVNSITLNNAQYAKIKLASSGGAAFNGVGVDVRISAPPTDTRYGAELYTNSSPDQSVIFKGVAGVITIIANDTVSSWAVDDVITFTVRDDTLNAFRNGSLILSITDSAVSSGRIGCHSYTDNTPADIEGDDFEGGDLPISFVAAGTEGEAASGNCTPGLPAGIMAGDVLICCCHSSDQVAHTMVSTAWTQIVQANGGGTTSRLSVWWHRYNGVTAPSAVITHASGSGIIAGIAAFRGCKKGGSPVNIAGTIAAGTTATIAHNSIVPTINNCLLLIINGAADDNIRTIITGTINVFEDTVAGVHNAFIGTLGTVDESISMFYRDCMAAATGAINVTQAAADPCAGVLVALEPELSSPATNRVLYAVKRAAFH